MARIGWNTLLLGLALTMTACNSQGGRQKAKWDQQNIHDYRYTLRVMCFCPPPAGQAILVEVKNGVTTSIKDAESGEAVDPKFLERYTTIPKLFDIITDAEARHAAKLDVQYDLDFGFPTNAFIDYIAQAVDDELGFMVEGFEAVK